MVKDEEAAIARRQRIAEMLMAQGQEPIEQQTAGGYVVPVSPLSGVAKVAQQLAGAYMGKQADKQRAELEQKRLDDLSAIDFDSPDAANQLMKNGMVAEAIKLRTGKKEASDKIPTGFRPNDDGTIAPMPIAGGGNFMDYQIQLANQKAQIPGYGEPQKLEMAKEDQAMQRESMRRAEEAAARQQAAFERQQQQESKKSDLQTWRLENPNYEKYQAEISDAEANFDRLSKSIDAYKELLGKYNVAARHNPLNNSEIQSAYQAVTWPLRDESMINTGVLNPGDMKALEAAITDPTAWNVRGFRGDEELIKQLETVLNTARTNVDAIRSKKSPKTPPPGTDGKINIDIKDPANDTPETRAAIAADIAKDQAKGLTPQEQAELEQLRARFGKK